MVQGFIASRLLEKNLIGKADAARGKFRNFLMTALERYAVDQFREASALKRQGDSNQVDVQEYAPADHNEDPAVVFDRLWATELVRQAIDQMREATEKNRPDLWAVFQDRVIGPAFDGSAPTSYAGLMTRLGFKDEGQAANTLHTAKRIFSRIVRSLAAEYAPTAQDVDDEVGELLGVLASRRNRCGFSRENLLVNRCRPAWQHRSNLNIVVIGMSVDRDSRQSVLVIRFAGRLPPFLSYLPCG